MKVDTEDALLFGSLALAAVGVALTVLGATSNPLLAIGLALVVFGLPCALITLLAAGDNS